MSDTLHVTYGDDLADELVERDPSIEPLVIREALRDGPLTPTPAESLDAFVAMRARHLASEHDADEASARDELAAGWHRIFEHGAAVVLYVDELPCIDCATFAACALDFLHRAGHAIAGSSTGVQIVRGTDPAEAVELTAADVAAGAGAWHLLVAGDDAGLTLAATDLEGRGGMGGFPELPALLVTRARGDVALDDIHPG
jgi:hypothetical protein